MYVHVLKVYLNHWIKIILRIIIKKHLLKLVLCWVVRYTKQPCQNYYTVFIEYDQNDTALVWILNKATVILWANAWKRKGSSSSNNNINNNSGDECEQAKQSKKGERLWRKHKEMERMWELMQRCRMHVKEDLSLKDWLRCLQLYCTDTVIWSKGLKRNGKGWNGMLVMWWWNLDLWMRGSIWEPD